eukprot:gene13374-3908_t
MAAIGKSIRIGRRIQNLWVQADAQRCFSTTSLCLATLYDTLGVSPTASANELKAAYKRKVKQHHPDVSKSSNASKMFAEVKDAYDALSSPDLRKEYDQKLMYGQ